MLHRFVGILIVVCSAYSGLFFVFGKKLDFNKMLREPAAVRKNYDFTQLYGSALEYASQQQLLAGLIIKNEPNQIGIALGHFLVKGTDGEKEFACQRYSKIILELQAEGIAVDGEKPSMEIEGACEVSSDISQINPLWIPVSKILGEPPMDGELSFREGKAISLRFTNMTDSWPKTWSIKKVKLLDPNGKSPELSVEPSSHMIVNF